MILWIIRKSKKSIWFSTPSRPSAIDCFVTQFENVISLIRGIEIDWILNKSNSNVSFSPSLSLCSFIQFINLFRSSPVHATTCNHVISTFQFSSLDLTTVDLSPISTSFFLHSRSRFDSKLVQRFFLSWKFKAFANMGIFDDRTTDWKVSSHTQRWNWIFQLHCGILFTLVRR